MSAKHTPGPWCVSAHHPTNAAVHVCVGDASDPIYADDVATLYGPHEGGMDENGIWPLGEERMANARLIAAAPDLKERANAVCLRLDEWAADNLTDEGARDWFGHVEPAIANLRAAIAKAEHQS